ncbi:four helix bundle protein [Flavobacterium luminosum]|uniref:Four helix bundle protein n=1 Tax=Flavobacterium luminosum TaxID=2949086 RepID=A0ABT0TSV9_9FLAO|nr:four helix bundle protein [Flavobacterium sp. HXWNR70]MCL9810134.1 four helix bundle protein [Flavobacterium sp. HXWNR70]
MRNDKENLIVKLTFDFALEIISFSEQIRSVNRFEMASQIFRSGTSIGANIREAQNAESKADFIHKFKIAAKEADELFYWLELCKNSEYYPNPTIELFDQLHSINLIISKIISSSKRN